MNEVRLGQMTCPNCGISRGTDLSQCICGYNPMTGKVEEFSLPEILVFKAEKDTKYKLSFTLGDPSWDGHGMTSEYNIICNYSSGEIESAYKEMCEELGFDFLELFSEYECSRNIPEKYTKTLVENNIINSDRIITEETLSKCSWYNKEDLNTVEIDGEDDYLEIFFDIVRKKLPDLKWDLATSDFETLGVLHGAGYGLFRV